LEQLEEQAVTGQANALLELHVGESGREKLLLRMWNAFSTRLSKVRGNVPDECEVLWRLRRII
jgi:hypothetical protein